MTDLIKQYNISSEKDEKLGKDGTDLLEQYGCLSRKKNQEKDKNQELGRQAHQFLVASKQLREHEERRKLLEILRSELSDKIFEYLNNVQREGLAFSRFLLTLPAQDIKKIIVFNDYSILIFPAAKVYEGFLMKLANKIGFGKIDSVGQIFNRDNIRNLKSKLIDKEYKNVISDIISTWEICRCDILHYKEKMKINNLKMARHKYNRIIENIKMSYCAFIEIIDRSYAP